jgi:hypothetical protein
MANPKLHSLHQHHRRRLVSLGSANGGLRHGLLLPPVTLGCGAPPGRRRCRALPVSDTYHLRQGSVHSRFTAFRVKGAFLMYL